MLLVVASWLGLAWSALFFIYDSVRFVALMGLYCRDSIDR
ncbi:hypothetical protein JCM19236_6034 [Vibrio sp. JCM 19236]|nr:hypothetical protein JCM19236_6034 [Vibrio sp. JCM 19236]